MSVEPSPFDWHQDWPNKSFHALLTALYSKLGLCVPPPPTLVVHEYLTRGFKWLWNELVSLVAKEMLQTLIPNMPSFCGDFKIKVYCAIWLTESVFFVRQSWQSDKAHNVFIYPFLCFSNTNEGFSLYPDFRFDPPAEQKRCPSLPQL